MIVKRNLGDIAELTAGVISQRVLADKEDVETGDSVFVLVPKAIHDGAIALIIFFIIFKKTKTT